MSAFERLRETTVATGPRVVTAAHAAAAAAGAAAFAAGGNAFDAALSACFMETVALPMKAGLFGDLVALFRRGGGAFQALVSVGAGPLALADGARLERVGPRSVGVPGAPHGYATLHGFARLGLDRLVAPAARAATDGIPWTRVALSYVAEAADTLARLSPNNPYAPGGRLPALGDLRRLPGLGRLLEAFARRREALFDGGIGAGIAAELARRGGILRLEDLAQRPARLLEPVSGSISNGATLTATPMPTGGPRLIEVVRTALASGDPLPAIIRADRAGALRRGHLATDDGTSVVTAADDQGNVVVVLHSNSFPQFASGIVLDDGLVLNNRPGRGFDLAAPADAASAPRVGRVPPTTLHAWALHRGAETIVGATPGGVNQLPWNAQTVTGLIGGASPAESVTAPRWALDAQDALSAEPGADIGAAEAERLPPLSLRSAQQMIRLATGSAPHLAASDPRTACLALAVF